MLRIDARDMFSRQAAALLMAFGHGATHWVLATIYVILPFLGRDLGLSFAEIGGLITIFHAASFLANAGSGALVDITGRYLTTAWLSIAFGAGALFVFGFASDLIVPVAAIVVIGIAHNVWHPAAISLLSRAYPASRGFALSIHTLGASMGDILAPTCAGALMLVLSWQSAAMVNAVVALCVAAMVAMLGARLVNGAAAPSARKPGEISYLGALRALASDRSIILLCIMAGFRSMTQNGLMLFLPLYLVHELEAGPLLVGIAMTGIQAGALVSGPLAGAMSDRIGRKPVVLVCLAGTSIMIAAMNAVAQAEAFIAVACVLGFALFAVRPVIHGWALDLASERMSGSVISLLFGTQSAFTMLVPLVGGLIADQWGLGSTFLLLTATVMIAAGMAILIPNETPATQRPA